MVRTCRNVQPDMSALFQQLRLRARGFTSVFAVPRRAITRGWLWLADDSAADLTIRNHSERGAAEMASQSMREN